MCICMHLQRLSSDRYGIIPEPVCASRGGRLHKLAEQVELPQAEPPFQRFAVFDGHTIRFKFEGLDSAIDEDRYKELWPKLQAVVAMCKSKQELLQQTVDDSEF